MYEPPTIARPGTSASTTPPSVIAGVVPRGDASPSTCRVSHNIAFSSIF